MATSTWFVRSEGRIRGPFDAMHLHKMLQRGLLLWQHELSEDRRHWIKAQDHPMFEGVAPVKGSEPDLVIEPMASPVVRKGPPPLPAQAQRPRQAPPPRQSRNEPPRSRPRREPEAILEAELIEEVPTAHLLDLSDTVSEMRAPSLPETSLFDEIDLESWKET